MIDFEYLQPKTLEEAGTMLKKAKGKAIPYSGGTDALSLLKEEIITPEEVINLKNIPSKIASPQLRNMGTVGGNLTQRPRCWYFRKKDIVCLRKDGSYCYAVDGENKYHCVIGGGPCYIIHPSDTAVALLALDASVNIFSGKESRTVPLSEFFVLPDVDVLNETILKPGEIVSEIIVPELPQGTKSGYYKFMERDVWDFAVVSVAAVLNKNGSSIKNGKITYGGVAPIPWLDKSINSMLKGLQLDYSSLDKAVSQILIDAEPLEQNRYKIPLARNITKNLIQRLTS